MTRFHSWSGGGGCFVNDNDNACHTDGTNYLLQQEGGTNWAKGGWHTKENMFFITIIIITIIQISIIMALFKKKRRKKEEPLGKYQEWLCFRCLGEFSMLD